MHKLKSKLFNRFLPLTLAFFGLLVIAGGYFILKSDKPAEAAWYNSSWTYRKPITIDKNKVATSTALTNFPVLISVTDTDLKYTSFGGKVGKTDGTDILFTSSDGSTKLYHEIEKYSSSTGETIMWVQVPSLSGASDTTLYIYFGNSGASDQQAATSTWDSNFKAVWHLKETPTSNIVDVTSNPNDGTPTNMVSGDQVPGQIGGAISFNSGSNGYYSISSDASINLSTTFSVSGWYKMSADANYRQFYTSGTQSNYWYIQKDNSDRLLFTESGIADYPSTGVIGNGSWKYFTIVKNGDGASNLSIYIDGVLDSVNSVGTVTAPSGTKILGQAGGAGPILDEFRISDSARTAGWVKTEYNNQFDPGSFYAYGSLSIETVTSLPAASATGVSWYNSSWGYRRQITIDKNRVASSSLSNFPVLISVTDAELKYTSQGGKVGKTDGTDILFTSSDGTTKLDHEIEKYSSSTGETVLWVEVPTLSGTSDTAIFMYFGNSGASDQQAVTGTWESNYTGVYHLKDGTTLSTADSSTNVNNGTNNGATAATGVVDGGANFAPLHNRYISLGTNATTSVASKTQMTVSAWVKFATLDDWQIFYTDATSGNWWRYTIGLFNTDCSSGRVAFMTRDASTGDTGSRETICGTAPKANVWYYYSATYDSSGGVKTFYINGLPDATTSSSVGAFTSTASAGIAIGESLDAGYTFGGYIDEVRVSKTARTAGWVKTEYNNQSDPASFYAYGALQSYTRSGAGVEVDAAASGGGSWYNASWTYRKQITVDKNKVATSSSLSNFPMLFSVTDSELKHTSHGGRVGKTDGTDILFTSSDGTTKLSHEIEKYASSTGETVIWVKVPTLSGTSDTVLYMYYGNSGASDQQLATSTWDSNYQAVYHLPNGTTLSTNDSTSNARNGTPSGTPQSITGVVDGAVRFTAANKEAITTTYATDLTQWTVSFWVKSPAAPGASANIGVVHRDSNYGFTWDHTDSTFRGTFAVEATVNSWQGATVGTLNPNTWYYLVGSYTSGSLKAYNNGMLTGNNTSPSGNPVSEATSVAIGKRSNNATTSYFNGDVDEVRISNSVRLLDWISTEYNNQSDPASFYAYGATQTQNKSGAGGTGSAPAVKVRGQVKFR